MMTAVADIDLPTLIERLGVSLRRIGREYRSACPLHHGDNPTAFAVYQSRSGRWRWTCFTECGSGDAIAFVQRYHGLTFREACQMLGVTALTPSGPCRPAPPPPAEPPPDGWQTVGWRLIQAAERLLWTPAGAPARRYLHRRGLNDTTIRAGGLGYHPNAERLPAAALGLDADATYAAGIVIPYIDWDDGTLWRVQVRRLDNAEPRYMALAGSCGTPPYLIAPLTAAKPLVLVEGPLDALAVAQAAGDVVQVAATGATGCRAVHWIMRFAAPLVLIAHDADDAGETAAAYWTDALQPAAHRWQPTLHDPAEMLQQGGAALVRAWVCAGLAEFLHSRCAA